MSEVRALSSDLVPSAKRTMSITSQRFNRGPRSQYGMSSPTKVSTDTPSHAAASSRLRKRLGGILSLRGMALVMLSLFS